jgi:2,3-bisphosphoglycerate-independent phosphoglycerate mutase
MKRRALLVILDGWGLAPAGPGNAISLAETPNFDYLWTKFAHTKLLASGEAVGLPEGQMGNSEVGHLNIGAGRVVMQDLPRISESIKHKSFYKNPELKKLFAYAKKHKKPVHLMGLVSDGGVHSHEKHLFALLEFAKKEKMKKVYIHVFTDGRDTPKDSAIDYIKKLEKEINRLKIGRIATICGRYYALDRDNRWERTKLAYLALVSGQGELNTSPEKAIEKSYKRKISDEFIRPVIVDKNGLIKDGDAVIFFNLRSDRPRQLTRSLLLPDFEHFKREKQLKDLYFVTMTEYEKDLPVRGIAFPEHKLKATLAEVIAGEGLSQFHIAETEKYAHVTYFLNGGRETAFPNEDRKLIPSPKVPTYDLKPTMSAEEVTDELIKRIGKYDFIVVNYANPDMVGHTGKLDAAIKAVEKVDECLGHVVEVAGKKDYQTIIVADHGNAEEMRNSDGSPKTSHTVNPVPFILVGGPLTKLTTQGKLANIAPTILEIMGIEPPDEMTAKPLLPERRMHV